MGYIIRTAQLDDERELVRLWEACNLVASYNDPHHDFRYALGKPNSDILVSVDAGGHVVGSVLVGYDGHRGWMYYVATDPACRKQNIGRGLVEAAEEWLKKQGVAKVMLLVRPTNTQVVSFYEKLGFGIAPRTVMEKWLTKS